MALKFNETHGSAVKSNFPTYEYKNGDNKIRLVGDVLPRYVYWIKGSNGKNIPFECLAFNRETEKFDNQEQDWVREFYPDLKCGWAYAMLGITSEGEIKTVNLKKKLFESIITAAEDLGDPTNPDTGWVVHFKRTKTGPMAYNVEYQLQPLKCKPEPLTETERELIANTPTIDEIMPRPTAAAQKILLERLHSTLAEGQDDEVDTSITDEFDVA